MDFGVGLLKTRFRDGTIQVIVDRLTELHFFTYEVHCIYGEVGRNIYENFDYLHEVLVSRVSDCDPKFTSRF